MFSCSDTAWVLAFGLMILNTDMYNRNIRVRGGCGRGWWLGGAFRLRYAEFHSCRCVPKSLSQLVGRVAPAACQTDTFNAWTARVSQSVRR